MYIYFENCFYHFESYPLFPSLSYLFLPNSLPLPPCPAIHSPLFSSLPSLSIPFLSFSLYSLFQRLSLCIFLLPSFILCLLSHLPLLLSFLSSPLPFSSPFPFIPPSMKWYNMCMTGMLEEGRCNRIVEILE